MTSQPNTIDGILDGFYMYARWYGFDEAMDSKGDHTSSEPNEAKQRAKAALLEAIKSAKPDIDEHPCRFNDGECVCDCYKSSQDEYEQNLINLFGGKDNG